MFCCDPKRACQSQPRRACLHTVGGLCFTFSEAVAAAQDSLLTVSSAQAAREQAQALAAAHSELAAQAKTLQAAEAAASGAAAELAAAHQQLAALQEAVTAGERKAADNEARFAKLKIKMDAAKVKYDELVRTKKQLKQVVADKDKELEELRAAVRELC